MASACLRPENTDETKSVLSKSENSEKKMFLSVYKDVCCAETCSRIEELWRHLVMVFMYLDMATLKTAYLCVFLAFVTEVPVFPHEAICLLGTTLLCRNFPTAFPTV